MTCKIKELNDNRLTHGIIAGILLFLAIIFITTIPAIALHSASSVVSELSVLLFSESSLILLSTCIGSCVFLTFIKENSPIANIAKEDAKEDTYNKELAECNAEYRDIYKAERKILYQEKKDAENEQKACKILKKKFGYDK